MRKILMVALLLVSTSAFAQSQFRSAVKFVCGKADDEHIKAFAFAPGSYFTTINVSNHVTTLISGQKRFSIGLLNQKPGKFTPLVNWSLKLGETMQVDCGDIYAHLQVPPGTFIEGTVWIIGSPIKFDVTAVYTVTDGERIVSIDVEDIVLR